MTSPWGPIAQIASALLYEGYCLFPYRATSLKNRIRTSFGELSPRDAGVGRRSAQRAEIPIAFGPGATLRARIAFLQPIRRVVIDERGREVESLEVGERRIFAWQEAREVVLERGPITLADLRSGPLAIALPAPGGVGEEEVGGGRLRRTATTLAPRLHLSLREVIGGGTVLRCVLENDLASGGDLATMHSSHVALAIEGGAFGSVIDPPPGMETAAADCDGDGAWFVLAGPIGDRSLALASPIVLYDHPQVAPESPHDLFDATENDELLTLCLMALTDDERRSIRATDPRAAQLLDRTTGLDHDAQSSLHGAIRSLRDGGAGAAPRLRIGGEMIGVGDDVILTPSGRDSFDVALTGRRARVIDVVVEVEGREHLVVVLDDDPGRDLGVASHGLGHRFHLAPSEVAPAPPVAAP